MKLLIALFSHLVLSPEIPVEELYKEIHQVDDQTIVILKDQEPSCDVLKKVEQTYENKNVWMTLPDVESGISFYAGLFKRIKLEDLYERLDLHPLVVMAGSHAVRMPGHHPITMVAQRSPYSPICEPISIQPLTKKADLVVFSFDRPLQLYALLESVEKYVVGLGETHVVYRTSNADYAVEFEKVQRRFPHVKFLHQGDDPKKDFKPIFLKATFESRAPYVVFAVDDNIVKSHVDLSECIELLEDAGAFGFYLRLGKHIDYSYMSDVSQPMPPAWEIREGVCAWQFRQGQADWKYPCSLDMTLYKKSVIKKHLTNLTYHNPNLLESAWALKGNHRRIGLCFAESKIINIPLNMVNQSNMWSNRNITSYSPLELLDKMQSGLKIDIAPLHHIVNRSPHIEFEVTFIPLEEK